MRKKVMLVMGFVALVAVPSFAAVQNVKVGGALNTTSVIRSNFDANITRDHQNEILARTHLDVAADLTDNVSTNIGLLQERVWGDSTADTQALTSGIDVDTANVTMKELFYAPLTVTIGRQALVYGNALIVGGSGVSGAVTAISDLSDKINFDAVKAELTYDPMTVEFFASRVANNDTFIPNETNMHDNINLYGVNANYKLGDKMSTVVEAYVFYKQNDSGNTRGAVSPNIKSTTTIVPGLRISTNIAEGLNIQLEGAAQAGQYSNTDSDTMQSRSGAFALQGMLNYALPVMKDMKPIISAAYTYLSGNKPGTTKSAWDPMYEDQNGGRIFDTISGSNSNIQLASLGMEISPLKDVTAKLSLSNIWKAERAEYVDATTSSSKHIGSELDADISYAYTEDVTFGLSGGYFMTGKSYVSPNNKNASQLLTSISVLF